MKKSLKIILLSLIFLIPITVYAENLTPIVEDTSHKVYDYADKLEEEQEEELQNLAYNYLEKYKMDMPLINAVQMIVRENAKPSDVVKELMNRSLKTE